MYIEEEEEEEEEETPTNQLSICMSILVLYLYLYFVHTYEKKQLRYRLRNFGKIYPTSHHKLLSSEIFIVRWQYSTSFCFSFSCFTEEILLTHSLFLSLLHPKLYGCFHVPCTQYTIYTLQTTTKRIELGLFSTHSPDLFLW